MSIASDPRYLPEDVRHKLLLIRECFAAGAHDEAYHWLYAIASPGFVCFDPWAAIEGRSCQCGPHPLDQSHPPPLNYLHTPTMRAAVNKSGSRDG